MSTDLRFTTLRNANTLRLPQFKNSKGGPAHSKEDGSDWSPAQWLQAVIGELGEWCELRVAFEEGKITKEEFVAASAKELADVQTYFDIFAMRSLDITDEANPVSAAGKLMCLMADLGAYANNRKKLDRGDFDVEEYMKRKIPLIDAAGVKLQDLAEHDSDVFILPEPGDQVYAAHATGVDLTQAVQNKFNEVSVRVGSDVRIFEDRIRFFAPPQ